MKSLTETEIKRYHRQLIMPEIGEAGQDKLKKARVLVIGAGGLGSPVLMYLAAAGVGTLGIADPDEVTTGNLQRQILYTISDITKPKVYAAAERLSQLNPLITVIPYHERFSEENAKELVNGYDLAIDCCDNYATRYLLSDVTGTEGIPMVYGAVSGFMGQVSVFNYRGGPSYRDLYPEKMQQSSAGSEPLSGVIGILPGITGSFEAGEAIKIITGAGEILSGKLLQIDALNLRTEIISF